MKEFKPTIVFLAKFLGMYVAANLLYGVYVTAFEPEPDPVTRWVTANTAMVLRGCNNDATILDKPRRPSIWIIYNDKKILSVYEGCNGINVMIIFVAFLLAFGPVGRTLTWFIPLGLLIIHLVNLARIGLLFWVSIYMPRYLYFTHKYFFTAILYVVVFVLWIWWVRRYATDKPTETA
jgi:exosortase family protein XrtF